MPSSLSRRDLLGWIGNATVLALAPDLFCACDGAPATPVDPNTAGSAGASTTTPHASASFPFEPSPAEGALYDTWRGNTVDPQDVRALLSSWRLAVEGLVERTVTLSFSDLLALPRQNQISDYHCVEGWSVFDVPWNGLHIDRLSELVRPTSEVTHVAFHCVGDVYRESLPIRVAREGQTLLAYGIAGNTLPLTHGFPLRLVVPRLFAYKSAKWVNRIVFTNAEEAGYWEQRGYPADAEVPASR